MSESCELFRSKQWTQTSPAFCFLIASPSLMFPFGFHLSIYTASSLLLNHFWPTHPLHNDWVTDYSLLFIIILCFKILDLRTGSGVEEEVPGGLAIGFPSVLRPRVSAAVLFRLPALPPKRLLLDFIRPYSKLHTTKSHCQCPNTVFSYYRKSPYRRPCRQIRKPVYAHKIFGVQSKLPSQILQIHNR